MDDTSSRTPTAVEVCSALDSLPILVAILDRDGVIVGTNASWRRAASHHPACQLGVGTNYLDVCVRAAADNDVYAQRALSGIRSVLSGGADAFALEYRCRGLRDLWSEMRVARARSPESGAVVAHLDITQYKQDGARTTSTGSTEVDRDGLQSLSELSAAIAHEIKQPLAAIRTNAEASRRWPDAPGIPGPVRDALGDIVRDTVRISEALDALEALNARDRLPAPVDLNELIDEVAGDFSTWTTAGGVQLRLDLDVSLPPVQGSARQLRLVLRNVLSNAVDATLENRRDRLVTIATSKEHPDTAMIRVVDNGEGVRDDVRGHVFEPFFSTKRTGTGIGLALAHTIVQGQGGTITIRNAPGTGAIVEIRLPLIPG